MTESLLVLLRSSTPIPWKVPWSLPSSPFSLLSNHWVIYSFITVTLSSKLPVVRYWFNLLSLIMFILISEIREIFLPYFPSKSVLRLQTRGIEMTEQRGRHSSKSTKQLRDQFVKVSRFSLVLFHLITLSFFSRTLLISLSLWLLIS
jgi:hypothetical protein